MKYMINITFFLISSLFLIIPCKAEVYTDYEICRTQQTGCVKCTDSEMNNCLVCREGLMIKSFLEQITESKPIEEIGGYCVSGINIYDDWYEGVHKNASNTTNITIEQLYLVNYANDAKKFINFYIQIFDESLVYPTLETLERVEMAIKVKSQLLERLEATFMPANSIENARALVYGLKSTFEIEYRLINELGFVPQNFKDFVIKDINLAITVLQDIKANFKNDDYIAYYGLYVLDLIMKYYELKVLDLETLQASIKKMLISEPEEWLHSGGYFPIGIPSKINHYVLELLEESENLEELFTDEESNETQTEVSEAINNLIIQYAGFNPEISTLNLNFDEFSFAYFMTTSSRVLAVSLYSKTMTVAIPENYFSIMQKQNNIDENDGSQIMVLIIEYKHINPYGNNPDDKTTSVADLNSYQIRLREATSLIKTQTNLEEISESRSLYLPTTLKLSITFNANTGTNRWDCIEYDNEWEIMLNSTKKQDIAQITCEIEKFGIYGFQKRIPEDNATWANIGMHCSWFWLAFVSLLCAAKVFLFDLFRQAQIEENEGIRNIKFAPFTISMPISVISAVGWGDIAYKCLFMLAYFAVLSVGLAYNIQENSDDENETWMDFYTAFRVLIIAWIAKYFFGSLRIIQNDCFHSPAPLSIVLIISYFVGMYFCQRELASASNDRQEQWLLTLVIAVVMDIIIDFIIAIIISIFPEKSKKGLLTGMRLGGFVTFAKPQAYHLGYSVPEVVSKSVKHQED